MISMAGKAIRRWWALFALPTFAAFIIGFLVPFIMGVYLSFGLSKEKCVLSCVSMACR